ncbi:MAG: hypothetical protein ACXWDM_02485 [Nocardioides sp.]
MTAMTRGPLPARVYWTRRLLVIGVVVGLLVAVVQLVSLAVGGAPEPDRAVQVVAEPGASETPATDVTEPEDAPSEGRKKKGRERDPGPVLAAPEGPCTDRDIAVTPTAKKTVGGSPVTFVLELRTILTPACTWEVSPQTLTVKITSGDDDVWFSNQCPRAIPHEDVVIRNNVSTEVEVTWSAKRSDQDCRGTTWAMPGWYFIEAAALAGEPSDLQFELAAPEPEVVTETVDPEPKQGDRTKRGDGERDGAGRRQGDEPRQGGRRSD